MTRPSWIGSSDTTLLQKQIYAIMDEGGTQFYKACRIAEEIEAGTLRDAAAPDLRAALEEIAEILTVPDLGEDEYAYTAFAFEAMDNAREIARAALAGARGGEADG